MGPRRRAPRAGGPPLAKLLGAACCARGVGTAAAPGAEEPLPRAAPTPALPPTPAAECGAKGADDTPWAGARIVNGQAATHCEWKWHACLKYPTGDNCWCGGTLIDSRWVLTAAHCVSNRGTGSVAVELGEYDKHASGSDGTEVQLSVSSIVVHPDYNDNTLDNDFALLELDSPAPLNDCIGLACLPSEDVAPGASCWITGWGYLSSGGSQPRVLQEATVATLSHDDCESLYSGSGYAMTEKMLCAVGALDDGSVVDGCQGDSGGPLVCESGGSYVVHGATSWGVGCAHSTYPGVWSRVFAVRGWIDHHVFDIATAPPTPAPTAAPVVCAGNSSAFDGGYGGCDTYKEGLANHDWCDADVDGASGLLAEQVCKECSACLPPCVGDAGAFSGCAGYAVGGVSYESCGKDSDAATGLLAAEVCAECEQCVAQPASAAPTAGPIPEAPPTPAPPAAAPTPGAAPTPAPPAAAPTPGASTTPAAPAPNTTPEAPPAPEAASTSVTTASFITTSATATSATATSATATSITATSATATSATASSTTAMSATATSATITSTTAMSATASSATLTSSATSSTLTSTTTPLYVVGSSISFESSGTLDVVASAVTSHLVATYGVSEAQLSVHVSEVAPSARGANASGSTSWQADFELVADQQTAEQHFEALGNASADPAGAAAAMQAAFAQEGLELVEESVAVSEPEIAIVTATRTTVSATATSATATATSATASATATSATATATSTTATVSSATATATATATSSTTLTGTSVSPTDAGVSVSSSTTTTSSTVLAAPTAPPTSPPTSPPTPSPTADYPVILSMTHTSVSTTTSPTDFAGPSGTSTTASAAEVQHVVSHSMRMQVSDPDGFVSDSRTAEAVRGVVSGVAGVPASSVLVRLSTVDDEGGAGRRLAAAAAERRLQTLVLAEHTIHLGSRLSPDVQAAGASAIEALASLSVDQMSGLVQAAVEDAVGHSKFGVSVTSMTEATMQQVAAAPWQPGGTDPPDDGTTAAADGPAAELAAPREGGGREAASGLPLLVGLALVCAVALGVACRTALAFRRGRRRRVAAGAAATAEAAAGGNGARPSSAPDGAAAAAWRDHDKAGDVQAVDNAAEEPVEAAPCPPAADPSLGAAARSRLAAAGGGLGAISGRQPRRRIQRLTLGDEQSLQLNSSDEEGRCGSSASPPTGGEVRLACGARSESGSPAGGDVRLSLAPARGSPVGGGGPGKEFWPPLAVDCGSGDDASPDQQDAAGSGARLAALAEAGLRALEPVDAPAGAPPRRGDSRGGLPPLRAARLREAGRPIEKLVM